MPRFTRLLQRTPNQRLCDQLNDTTGLLDLLLGITAEVTGADNDGDLGETALAEDLGVAEGQEVDDGGGVGLGAGEVGIALLGGDEGPQLYRGKNPISSCFRVDHFHPNLLCRFEATIAVRMSSAISEPNSQQVLFQSLGFHLDGFLPFSRTLSRLIVGFQNCCLVLWKYRIPTLPK